MFTANEKHLERFVDVVIHLPPFGLKAWELFFEEKILTINGFSEKELNWLRQKDNLTLNAFFELLQRMLNTPRLFKLFARQLTETLADSNYKEDRRLNVLDLLGITAVQVTNPSLYEYISSNPEYLNLTNFLHYRYDFDQEKKRQEENASKLDYLQFRFHHIVEFFANQNWDENCIQMLWYLFFSDRYEFERFIDIKIPFLNKNRDENYIRFINVIKHQNIYLSQLPYFPEYAQQNRIRDFNFYWMYFYRPDQNESEFMGNAFIEKINNMAHDEDFESLRKFILESFNNIRWRVLYHNFEVRMTSICLDAQGIKQALFIFKAWELACVPKRDSLHVSALTMENILLPFSSQTRPDNENNRYDPTSFAFEIIRWINDNQISEHLRIAIFIASCNTIRMKLATDEETIEIQTAFLEFLKVYISTLKKDWFSYYQHPVFATLNQNHIDLRNILFELLDTDDDRAKLISFLCYRFETGDELVSDEEIERRLAFIVNEKYNDQVVKWIDIFESIPESQNQKELNIINEYFDKLKQISDRRNLNADASNN